MAISLTRKNPKMDYVHRRILVRLSTGSALDGTRPDSGQGEIQAASEPKFAVSSLAPAYQACQDACLSVLNFV
jgi:hypothetical protein